MRRSSFSASPSRGFPGRWRGALLLSELAGSAQVLPGALLVNPWDVDGVVEHLATALGLSARERQRRLETMSKRVEDLDSRRWADGFLRVWVATRVASASRADRRPSTRPSRSGSGSGSRGRGREQSCSTTTGRCASSRSTPDLAQPTPEIRALLRALVEVPNTDVHIVSGRRRRNLEQWFGRLPVHLCAEHGYLARAPGEEWRTLIDLDLSWLRPIERLLRRVAADVPGAHVEREVVQRRVALPAGRARVRAVARAGAAQRPASAPAERSGRDPARSSGRRGPRSRRGQGRLRAESVPERQGGDALRARTGERPHRSRPARGSACRLDRRPRRRSASERAECERPARGRPSPRAGGGSGPSFRGLAEGAARSYGSRGTFEEARSSTSATRRTRRSRSRRRSRPGCRRHARSRGRALR